MHSLKFAEDLVGEWLKKYKFKKWLHSNTLNKPVTEELREERAQEIAKELSDHAKWRLHERSIKIEDLKKMKLKITCLDNNPNLADIVYRIQTVCSLLFKFTPTYKIFATKDNRLFSQMFTGKPTVIPQKENKEDCDFSTFEHKCKNCNIINKFYIKFKDDNNIDKTLQLEGFKPFPKDGIIKCDCGYDTNVIILTK